MRWGKQEVIIAMKADVLKLARLQQSSKIPSKETLNHPGLIELVSGIDPFINTGEAYLKAYQALGIDIINRVPEENAPTPLSPGETCQLDNGYQKSHLGVYDTYARYQFPFTDVEEFLAADSQDIELNYQRLITPVPHSLNREEIEWKMNIVGDIGLYYYMLYTTLFMWGVEYLGWEVFMMAATLRPDEFEEKFLDQAFSKSLEHIKLLSQIDSPFVFVHDDLADKNGPVFPPNWYHKYIFPRYEKLWAPVKESGKKLIFVADGDMSRFLRPLRETGVDGVMLENPATDFDEILKYFGDGIIIGGINTNILTFGNSKEIKEHVLEVYRKTKGIPGFAMSTPGGIHGNIPLDNLKTYFNTRAKIGYTPENWSTMF